MSAKYYLIGLCCCLIIAQGLTVAQDDSQIPTVDSENHPLEPNHDSTDLTATDIAPHTKPTPTTTAKPTTTNTTEKPTTPTSTEKPTTPSTTEKPTTPTSTEKPTTPSTTEKPTTPTSTEKPTTPSTTEKPTTAAPTPTTTGSPSTTTAPPTPAPLPDPEVGTWTLKNTTTNLTCVVIRAAVRMKIPYLTTSNKTEWVTLNLNKTANITGNCNNETTLLNVTKATLQWDNNTNSLEMTFTRYNESKTFNITHIVLSHTTSSAAFPNSTGRLVIFGGSGTGLLEVESVPLGSSYRCSHKVNVNLTEENTVDTHPPNATLTFSKVQVQAYVYTENGGFGGVYDCPGMDASDIVPIAVGCALAGLVIGVLIAYLVGRRRSHARGYLSM